MSRLSLFVFVAALTVYCASSVPINEHVCPPGKVWDVCPDDCNNRCPEAIPQYETCLDRFCKERCVCQDGKVESKNGECIHPLSCETRIFLS